MQPRVDAPYEPVISSNECNAAFRLMRQMCDNIVARGDVPEEIIELCLKFSESVQALSEYPTGEAADAAYAAMFFLPTFRHDSSQKDAGAALLRLIQANSVRAVSVLKSAEGSNHDR